MCKEFHIFAKEANIMLNSYKPVSMFLLSLLILAACQNSVAPTPKAIPSTAPTKAPTNLPPATSTLPPTSEATKAPTATLAPVTTLGKGECVELIQNGDFETGSIEPWKETSSSKPSLLIQAPPGRGKFAGFLGGGSG